MGRYCCVPNCTSNKHGKEYTTCFRFPKNDEMKKKWIKSIPRDFLPNKDSVVCIKHFEKEAIIYTDRITSKDGNTVEYPRIYPKLSDDAVPKIFQNLPAYLTKLTPVRSTTIERKRKMEKLDDADLDTFLEDDRINDFREIKEELQKEKNRVDNILQENKINIYCDDNAIHFMFLKCNGFIEVTKSVNIDRQLKVTFYAGKQIINNIFILLNNNTLSSWGELINVLTIAKNYNLSETNQVKIDNHAKAIEYWRYLIDENRDSENYESFNFILEQMILCNKSIHGRNYSSDLLIFAYCIYTRSTSCYLFLSKSKLIFLPSLRHLKRIAVNLNVTPGISTAENNAYLKTKFDNLNEHSKIGNILLDEIYIKPNICYKSKKLVGFANNNDTCVRATTVQAFMYTSLFSKDKEIIALIPVKNLNAEDLLQMTNEVLHLMEKIGFRIISIISDNNRINRNMFAKLCGDKELKSFIPHPFNSSQKLFILFDSVHLIKSLRNNWISQLQKSFYYPDPKNIENVLIASFLVLEKMYHEEKDFFVKTAPKLNSKALYPTSIEKQNVNLALKVFDKTNSVALKLFLNKFNNVQCTTTATFIDEICKWWEIMNIKNPHKGFNLRLDEAVPFTSPNDSRLQYLEEFSKWIKSWENFKHKPRHGCLSSETFFALRHTTNTMIQLIQYILNELKAKYVLTGKFQTDNLEGRFGQYREMAGSNYYISVQQILEAEKKLRIKSILKCHSDSNGEIAIKDFISVHTTSTIIEDVDVSQFELILETLEIDNIFENDIKILVYIGGYCVKKLDLSCKACLEMFTLNQTMEIIIENEDYSYLNELNRGGLKFPTSVVVDILSISFILFKSLVSKEYENKFVQSINPFSVFAKLSVLAIEMSNIIEKEICSECSVNLYFIAQKITETFANICLNNYSKKCNEIMQQDKNQRKVNKFNS